MAPRGACGTTLEVCAGIIPARCRRLCVAACGVCRTVLHICDGELPFVRSPLVPGHEIVGRVEALGAGVDGLARVREGRINGAAVLVTGGACQPVAARTQRARPAASIAPDCRATSRPPLNAISVGIERMR